MASNLIWVYFSFFVFFISNYSSSASIFSPYLTSSGLAGSAFFSSFFSSFFFLGIFVSSNHYSTKEHSSKVTSPSSLNLILKDTPKVSSLGFWGFVTKYPMCFLNPVTAGSYSIKISMASLRVNFTVLLVGTLDPAS